MKNEVFDNVVNDLRLHIHCSGHCVCDKLWQTENLATAFCRLYIPLSGGGSLYCGGKTVEMIPGNAYLLPPEEPVSYSCPKTMQKLFFHLSFLSPNHYDLFLGCKEILQIPLRQSQLEEYIERYHSKSYYGCIRLKQLLYGTLLDLYQQEPVSNQEIPSYSAYVRETMTYIHQNLSAKLTVRDLAKRQYVSYTTLNKYFRAELGMTAGKYIDDQLLIQAKSMLCYTSDSIAEISRRLEFSDPFYFSNKFKSLSGFTPRAYRKLHTELSANEPLDFTHHGDEISRA